ncbi:Lar family restriction alleviation protein [Pseudomonas sp.]|uniref:Lar family restriction alleviation protein n=1 Tax=Pseudomonas sp. TaxID=306 RepID=UPI0027303B6E|nr:Lar family restriction alleviation protein [Pseudomonas sp.]MDP2447648.1 Lar family restriction alleviation protein [Pseudomonas sp.]MDZ4334308.1 Lar family restriction alleviation protein [Pseudomonas sp.]
MTTTSTQGAHTPGNEAPTQAAEQITLPPCPFCEGPPAVIVTRTFEPFGSVEPTEHFGCTGLDVDAYVFCHECGAEGPKHETVIFTQADYLEAERAGAVLWTERSAKHRHLYDAGSPEGLNLYPQEAGQ